MQNFLAIFLFAVLVATVFWPDEVFRSQASRTTSHINLEERNANTRKTESSAVTGAGMFYHYIGIEERQSRND